MRASRGLKWENKMYKLKRSISFQRNRPSRLTQSCIQFKPPGVNVLRVLYLHYNVAFTFK